MTPARITIPPAVNHWCWTTRSWIFGGLILDKIYKTCHHDEECQTDWVLSAVSTRWKISWRYVSCCHNPLRKLVTVQEVRVGTIHLIMIDFINLYPCLVPFIEYTTYTCAEVYPRWSFTRGQTDSLWRKYGTICPEAASL